MNYNNIYKNHVKVINKILKNNLQNVINKYDSIEFKNIKTVNPDSLLFQDDEYVLSDKYINNDYILKYYHKYIYFNKENDSIINRIKWLFE